MLSLSTNRKPTNAQWEFFKECAKNVSYLRDRVDWANTAGRAAISFLQWANSRSF